MTKPKVRAELAALRIAALEDILNTPDAELRREAIEDGEDPAAIAADVKSWMQSRADDTTPSTEALRAAYTRRRSSDWPATFELAMSSPIYARLIALEAQHPTTTPAANLPVSSQGTKQRRKLFWWEDKDDD